MSHLTNLLISEIADKVSDSEELDQNDEKSSDDE